MFSSLRSRLWLSYALLIVTALGLVAMVLFISLLRNPLLYRQTTERLQAVQTVVMEREGAINSLFLLRRKMLRAHLMCVFCCIPKTSN